MNSGRSNNVFREGKSPSPFVYMRFGSSSISQAMKRQAPSRLLPLLNAVSVSEK